MVRWVLILFACVQVDVPAAHSQGLRGVVVDSGGKPLSGVDVWLGSGLPPQGERPSIGGMLWMAGGSASLAELQATLGHTKTKDDGEFRLELPAEIVQSQEPMAVAVWAHVRRAAWR